MALPFEVPADLTTLTDAEFAEHLAAVRAHASAASADESLSPEDLNATLAAYRGATAEDTRRTEVAARYAADRAELAAALAPVETLTAPAVEPTEVLPATTPAAPAPVAVVASTIDEPANLPVERRGSLVASSDSGRVGQELKSFADAGVLIEQRLASYGSSVTSDRKPQRIGDSQKFVLGGRTLNRHGVVSLQREMDPQLRIRSLSDAPRVLEYAREQSRLRGGSLLNALGQSVAGGRALTAAVGWCAPSETIYDLVELETLDGILDLPTIQASRGGFQIPENGGVNFSYIWNNIGASGDVILTEYEVENGVDKVCVEIPCPDFVDVRLDVAYICITGALLQQRGYPEAVTRFSRGAMVALAHKVNQSVISRMVTQTVAEHGAAVTIATPANNTDASSQILAAAELAAIDMRYRHRLSTTQVLEMVLPVWALGPIRAAISRRSGVAELDVTDAEILSWFAVRNIAPRFVYDWQDAYSGLSGGPGASTAITAYPANVQFLIYPAGTWVKAERDVINLDTVYDNALLTQNQFTALFAEDGFNVLLMGPDTRLYQTGLPVGGVTGHTV